MTFDTEQFSRQLDRLLELRLRPPEAAEPVMRTAGALLALDFEPESRPPQELRARWVSGTQMSRPSAARSIPQGLRARPILALILLVLALLLLTGVVYAIGRSLGYIPGVGLVEQSTELRVLAAPVKVTSQGITVIIDSVVADTTRTVVDYRLDGIPVNSNGFPLCGQDPFIRLADATELRAPLGARTSGEMQTFEGSPIYPPLPAGTTTAALVFPCILPEGSKPAPVNWVIPFSLVPAPADLVTPAVELAVTYQASGPTSQATARATPVALTPSPHGTGLYLNKVVELANSYLLIGSFIDPGNLSGQVVGCDAPKCDSGEYPIDITDADGESLFANPRTDLLTQPSGATFDWAYEVTKPIKAPLTLRLQSVIVETSASATLRFDPGPNPHIGQTWPLNRPISLLGNTFVFTEISLTRNTYIVTFNFPMDPNPAYIYALGIRNADGSLSQSYSSFVYPTYARYIVEHESGKPPAGPLTIEIDASRDTPLAGPWTITWSPPVNP